MNFEINDDKTINKLEDCQKCYIKKIDPNPYKEELNINCSLKNILKDRNRHIVEFKGYYIKRGYTYLVFEKLLFELRNDQFVKHYINKNQENTRNIAYQVLKGLEVLHSLNIIHADLKPENIGISKKGVFKLIDFGASFIKGSPNSDHTRGTLNYISPEVLLRKGSDCSTDIWSLGVTIYELYFGFSLYRLYDENLEAFKDIKNSLFNFMNEKVSSEETDLKNFLLSCLVLNPCERKTVSQLLNHSWFQSIHNEYESEKLSLNMKKTIRSYITKYIH